jgi:hypothetical protein
MFDRMERMYNKGLDSSSAMTGHLMNQKNKEKEEYKSRLERQEDRMDKTQDKALDYATRNNKAGNKEVPPPPNLDYYVNLPGQESTPKTLKAIIAMIKNGQIERTTRIYNQNKGEWVYADTIEELIQYFNSSSNTKSLSNEDYGTCNNCGYDQLESGARFCPQCGNEPS